MKPTTTTGLMINTYSDLVWKILSGLPVEVYDEEDHSVWSNDLWELVVPRSEGDYAGQRIIGTANIVTAYNLMHLKLVETNQTVDSLELFRKVMEHLNAQNLIRRRPERVRQLFKTV